MGIDVFVIFFVLFVFVDLFEEVEQVFVLFGICLVVEQVLVKVFYMLIDLFVWYDVVMIYYLLDYYYVVDNMWMLVFVEDLLLGICLILDMLFLYLVYFFWLNWGLCFFC